MRREGSPGVQQSPFAPWASIIQLHALQHGIDFTDEQRSQLIRYLEYEKSCDNVLDSMPLLQRGMAANIALDFLRSDASSALSSLKSLDISEARKEHLATSLEGIKAVIPSDRRMVFVGSLEALLKTTLQLHQEKSVFAAVGLRRATARQNVEVLLNVLPTATHNAIHFDRFQRMEMLELQIGDLMDTFRDFPQDVQEGTLSVAPILFNRLAFGIASIISLGRYIPASFLNALHLYFSPDNPLDLEEF